MYYIGRDRIWRNDDVTQIPLHPSLDTVAVNTGWTTLDNTKDTTREISALAISHIPANRLYYGTVKGKVYRMDSAAGADPSVKNITGPGFPSTAYVSCIAISPVNADQVIVVFSNYNVQSLFYTTNGGTSWTNISANLEQFSDGTGNGPSCRWAAIMPVGNSGKTAYFIGTSTGLYATDSLKANKTVWTHQSPDGIGNNIVTMIDTRISDGLVALATHGNGVYTAHINFAYQVSGIDDHELALTGFENLKCYPNPAMTGGNITLECEQDITGTTSVTLLNEEGKSVGVYRNVFIKGGSRQATIKLPGLKKGIYYLRLESGNKTAVKSLVIS
jgi:hypothetical protein